MQINACVSEKRPNIRATQKNVGWLLFFIILQPNFALQNQPPLNNMEKLAIISEVTHLEGEIKFKLSFRQHNLPKFISHKSRSGVIEGYLVDKKETDFFTVAYDTSSPDGLGTLREVLEAEGYTLLVV
jgi:hypothetical protein